MAPDGQILSECNRLIRQQRDFFVASVLSFDCCFPGRDSHLFDGLSSAIEH
jgi:hypothetical protein